MLYEVFAALLLVTLIVAVLKRRRRMRAFALLALIAVVAGSSQFRHDFSAGFLTGYHEIYASLGGAGH